MIPLISDSQPRFPDPAPLLHRHDGLIALSHTLNTTLLLAAYTRGIFPWHNDGQYFYWFATAPRFVLTPNALHIGRSLRKTLHNHAYRITVNHAFAHVIAHCATTARPNQHSTWISPEFQSAYTALHRIGRAHSFEYWLPENGTWRLAGGLYGVQIGRVFYGESMFSHAPDASKIAFVHAVRHLEYCGIALIDCQQNSTHMARFGAKSWAFTDFQAALSTLNAQHLTHPITPAILAHNPPQS